MFNKEDRSKFPYWFAHWCAFQMTALNLGCWKFRFLFHDIEKPWLRLLLSYKKVQHIHRKYSKHHPESVRKNKDYLAMVIDWECSRFTKANAQLNAVDTLYELHPELKKEIKPILEQLNLI